MWSLVMCYNYLKVYDMLPPHDIIIIIFIKQKI
jgi:hypothetical protein